MRILISFIFTFLFFQNLIGQTKIQGRLMDVDGEALPDVNILVYLPGNNIMIAYAVSDGEGRFQTKVRSISDSLDIELSSIQCRKEYHRIANISQSLQFELEYDVKQLDDYTVMAKPIERHGDTISYLVSSFAGKEDRAIEDVLRRMPGIEVGSNGKILYQGLPLQKFYVEGLDLMNGRYSMISKNLPHGTVGTVEILENHQPIRILEERVFSQQASLNLRLKRDITSTGTAKVGSGFSPFLWDVNITPMIFTKKIQVVTSYQTNNTGNDISQQLNILTLNELIQNADRPDENPGILNIQRASIPGIDQKRFLDNNTHLFNFNGLLRINRDFELRSNLYYVNDNQIQEAVLQRNLYTPSDTLSFTENINNRLRDNYLIGEFTLSRNVKKNYLKNELKIQSRWDKKFGFVNTGTEEVAQSLKNPLKSISNELRSVNPVGKKLIEFQSFISYDHSPQSLEVIPGQFDAVLNQDEPYNKLLQQIDLTRFFADHSASFGFAWKRLTFTPRIGIAFRKQMLESNIFISQLEEEREAGPDFANKLESRHTNAYLQTEVEYKKQQLTINAKLPISWQEVYLKDLLSDKGQELQRFLFNPRLVINYKFSNFWKVRGSWSYVNRLGDIDGIHYAYILKNYRNISQNAAALSETSHFNFSSRLEYKNPITSFFSSFSYLYSISQNNLIYNSLIQADGTSILQAFQLTNPSYSNSLNARSSKYFSAAKSTISFQANYNHRRGKSMINEVLFNSTTQLYSFMPSLNIHITSWMNSEYELDATYIQTFIENEKKSNISLLRHKFNFFAFPTKNQLISLSTEYYSLQGNNNFFADFLYRYTITKRKIDIELRWNNIFNTKFYTTYQASAFTVYESTYLLRPSQVFMSIKFSF
ncbi:MAG: hypothetical protein PF484_02815 [Bacteroidales bacterium]|jgi:hypothetical protein|nr:hypothetical protein [Bacteroidales bacterium]